MIELHFGSWIWLFVFIFKKSIIYLFKN